MKEFIKNNKDNVIIALVSIIAFIVGCLSAGFLISFIIIGLADAILIIPGIIKNRKKPIKGRHMSTSSNKSLKKIIPKEENNSTKLKKKKRKKSIWKKIIFIILILCIIGIISICCLAAYIVANSPKFDPKQLYHQEASILYNNDGEVFAKLGSENREIITYDELPEVLIDAIVATEDSRFFQHNGFDLPRFTKATIQTLLGSSSAGGASTLTMQLVKNHFTSTKKDLTRKFTDIYMAIYQVEKNYTKEEILEFYVNSPYLGASSYGVEQACQTYFGKSAKDINLAEAAMIAGLFQSPGADDPTRYPEKAEERRQLVLKLMERHGYITEEERKVAAAMNIENLLVESAKSSSTEYQGYIDTVVEEVKKDTGIDAYITPVEIYTTMDKDKQDYINDIMNGKTWDWKDDKVTAGIAVVDVKTGALIAVGAGRNKTSARTFNTATQLNNQIGSTAKPLYDYSVGIEYENWSTYEPFTDENISYSDGTSLNNWDGSYMGFLTLRKALAESRNISAVKAFKANDNANIKEAVTKMGLSPEENLHQAHAIGGYTGESPTSMAAAYATFANGGVYNSAHSYTKVIIRDTGKEEKKNITTNKVFSPQTAYIMTDLLQSSAKRGLLSHSNINGAVYGAKTGTSNFDEKKKKASKLPDNAINDYWVSGTSPDYAISVWYGYDKKDINSKYHNVFGTTYHERLFQLVGKGVFKKGSTFKNPGGVSSIAIENETYPAKLPNEYTPKSQIITELFKSGTEPTEVSDRYDKLSKVSNLSGTVSGNTLTLSWKGISTPSAIDDTKITSLAKALFETNGFQAKFVSSRKSYNSKNIGTLVYKIYGKDSNGNLNLIDTTSDTSLNITVNPSSPTVYVVKASYSIFTANMSDGVETTISLGNVANDIKLELKGSNPLTVNKGSFSEPGITIYENGEETNNKPSSIVYTNIATNTPVTENIMNSTVGAYIAEYRYSSQSITRNITIN